MDLPGRNCKLINGMRGLLQTAMLMLLAAACSTTPAVPEANPAPKAFLPGTADASPSELYWQLRFALALTEGIDEPLLAALQARYGPPDGSVPELPDLASQQGAVYRIASADSILAATADLAAFRRVAEDAIRAELRALEAAHPEAIAAIDAEILAEEILIVRSAILDSLESLAASDKRFGAPGLNLDAYREGTQRARNELEYVVFAREMDGLAAHSIDQTTGRLDAFFRMMNDSADTAFLREQILASEEMNRQLTDEHRDYSVRRTVRALFFLLPALSNYFRYR